MTWLDELKEGSAVIVVDGAYEDHCKTIGKVLRTTKTKVFLESGKVYDRRSGYVSPRLESYRYEIREASPEAVQRVREAKREYDLQGQVLRFFDCRRKWQKKLSISQMERIVAILNEE